ncbi:MAG: serine hydrolase [Patescibacteria group bacterium]
MKSNKSIGLFFTTLGLIGLILSPIFYRYRTKIGIIEHIQKPIATSADFSQFDEEVKYYIVYNPNNQKYFGKNVDKEPVSFASTIKVVVAYAVLKDIEEGKYTPETQIDFEDWDPQGNDAVGQNIKEALMHMLKTSSNSATNILIEKAGGFDSLNKRLEKDGFQTTRIKCYLGPSQMELKCDGHNTSTLLEIAKIYAFITRDSKFRNLVIQPMESTPFSYSHTNRVMNKSGINDDVLTNIATIDVDGQEYIVGGVYEEPSSASRFDNVTDDAKIRFLIDPKSKTDPISRLFQQITNQLERSKIE